MAATLTIILPDKVSSVSIGGRQYGGPFTYSAAVKFTSISISGSWTGTVYWGSSSGATTYKIASVTSGKVVMAEQEQIDYFGYDRTVYVTAVSASTRYYYQIHAFANNGYFSDGSTSYYTPVSSTGTSTSGQFDVGLLKEPSRDGYEFLGWGYTSNATTYYKDCTISVSATSTESRDPTIINLYAIWAESLVRIYVKRGDGAKALNVYENDQLKSYVTGSGWSPVDVAESSMIKVTVAAEDSCGPPYFAMFYASSSASSPASIIKSKNPSFTYGYASNRCYAEFTASSAITKFYWCGSDAADNNQTTGIVAGAPIINLKAASWNNLKDKIRALGSAMDITVSVGSDVKSGAEITASEFNTVRSAIGKLSSTALLPSEAKAGSQVKASYFNGGGSLKSAINWVIDQYNS